LSAAGDERSPESPRGYFEVSQPPPRGFAGEGSITNVEDYASYEIARGLFFRPVFASNLGLNFVTFPPNSGFPSHHHPEEQVSIVTQGSMEFAVGDLKRTVRPGDVIVVPPNVPHAGTTGTESCRLIDIFAPPRTGLLDVIAAADPVRGAGVERWWYDAGESGPGGELR
jgi:quercetin dioxygenase-like cupin family protein